MAIILRGKEGKISEKVIIVGNLERMKIVTSQLKDSELINEFAGYYAYTGKYNDEKFTVLFHGIGNASLSLIVQDLVSLGAKTVVRFGSATGISDRADAGTVVVPTGYSYNVGGFALQELGELVNFTAVGDLGLISTLVSNLNKANNIKCISGPMYTSDSIHTHDERLIQKWRSLNHLAIDLEGASLYFEGTRLGIRTGAVHLIYRNAVTGRSMKQEEITATEKELSRVILDSI